MTQTIKHVPLGDVLDSPARRFEFLAEFVGFEKRDWDALADSVMVLGPKLPAILDALYDHLLSYDDTRRIFLGERGELDLTYMAERKEHLTNWVLRVVDGGTNPSELAEYLSMVGKRHTGVAGEPQREVPPRYMVALTGFVQSTLSEIILTTLAASEPERATRMVVAWTRFLNIQLELFLKALAPHWPSWDEHVGR